MGNTIVISILDTVNKKRDNEAVKNLSILYLELAKAFDTVI